MSSGRLYIHWMTDISTNNPRRPAKTKATGSAMRIEMPNAPMTCWVM